MQTSYGYDPYGVSQVTGTASDNTFQFTGRENDNNGLYNYRNRYYNPAWGRFISEDPLGLGGGDVNLYRYAANNPVLLKDPSGLYGYAGPDPSPRPTPPTGPSPAKGPKLAQGDNSSPGPDGDAACNQATNICLGNVRHSDPPIDSTDCLYAQGLCWKQFSKPTGPDVIDIVHFPDGTVVMRYGDGPIIIRPGTGQRR
jgi:RHS repeat-associated protein